MAFLTQNLAYNRMLFLVNACDHLTKAISIASLALNISKAGAAFGLALGTISEVGSGWYKAACGATDMSVLGDLAFHITDATGKVDDTDWVDQVIAYNLANATMPANFSAMSIDGSGRVDAGKWMGSSLASCNVAGLPTMDLARWLGSIPNPLLGGRVDASATLAAGVPTNFAVLSIDGSGRVDNGKWMGSSLASVNVSGIPIVDLARWLGSIPNPLLAGRVDANATLPNGVIVTTNNDKTAYSLSQTFPSNFSSLAITAGGVVTANLSASQLFIKKNTALTAFMFLMIDSTDHVTPKTGLTVAGTVSIDGAAFGALTNAITEIANGVYKVNLAAADTNGTSLMLKFTATGADARYIPIITQT